VQTGEIAMIGAIALLAIILIISIIVAIARQYAVEDDIDILNESQCQDDWIGTKDI
jgi:cell division protein FtsL